MSKQDPDWVRIYSYVVLTVLVISAFMFLVLAVWNRDDSLVLKKICVQGDPALVFPGPGAPSPPAYLGGYTSFHKTEPYIEWNMFHGSLGGTVTAIDIIGPVFDTNPLNGPVIITVCDITTTVACVATTPNTLVQKITQTDLGFPIDDIVDKITANLERYKLRVRTTTFPGGAIVSNLINVCG